MENFTVSQLENLQKLEDITKDELELLKGVIRRLLACPSLTASGTEATAILNDLKKIVDTRRET